MISIYSDKLAHIQVVINYRYSVAQLYTREDGLAYILGAPFIDDFVSYDLLTTIVIACNESYTLELSLLALKAVINNES